MAQTDTTLSGKTGAAEAAPLLFTYSRDDQPWFRRSLIRAVERLSGRARLERLYRSWVVARSGNETIFAAGLRLLDVAAEVSAPEIARIPHRGGLLVLVNHPFGIIDGLVVGDLLHRLRGDVKILTHSLLCQPPEAAEVLLPVDFSPGPEARRISLDTRRRAQEWLAAGHVVVVFPAGSVSTSVRPWAGPAVDAAWHPFIVRLGGQAGVTVLPMFLHGQNSRGFQIVSHFSYPLRVALIFRETRAWAGHRVRLSVGVPQRLPGGDRAGAVAALRRACYALGGQSGDAEFVWPRWIRW